MHLDLFFELPVPPFGERDEARIHLDTLEEIALADQLGFGTAWLVEHHFMKGYSHSSAPDLFLAACAPRTQRIRLGLGIVPLPYHHPVHVAERVATLDILSRGRVEFGFGRGFSPKEYQAFAIPMGESRTRTQEALEVIRAAFGEGPLDFQGKHFHLEGLEVLPKPVQRPHPPLWMAAVSPESFIQAARCQVGVLAGPFKPWPMVKEDIRRYRGAWSGKAPPRVGMALGIFCLEDGKRARALSREGFVWFYRKLLDQTRPLLRRLYASYGYYRKFSLLGKLMEMTLSLTVLERLGMVVVGTPERCLERLEALREEGVDHVLCAIGAGTLPSPWIRESMAHLAGLIPQVSGDGP